jgi:hypothetical protein
VDRIVFSAALEGQFSAILKFPRSPAITTPNLSKEYGSEPQLHVPPGTVSETASERDGAKGRICSEAPGAVVFNEI